MLLNLAEWLRVASILIKPFLPRTAETFYEAFNFEADNAWDQVSYGDAAHPLKALTCGSRRRSPAASPRRCFPRSRPGSRRPGDPEGGCR